ncbi:MAG TPA: hypothetical protein VJ739_06360, partial [Gemmataceae bacterium]|nr:hypothetical protein [Gemmataceae bacterium]
MKNAAAVAGLFALAALALALPTGTRGEAPPGPGRPLPPFLDVFRANKPPAVAVHEVALASAVGQVSGYLARPDTPEHLPAVLLLPGEEGLTGWMKENA